MRQSVRRLLLGAGAVAAAGAMACGQGLASASTEARGQAGGASAAAATYVPPGKALYVGEHGRAVRSVQRRLNALHYYAGPVDGIFGLDLQEAAWAFREVQGLTMNASLAAEPINRAFERDLVHPKLPYVLIKHGPAFRVEINQRIEVLVLYKDDKVSLISHVSSGGGYYFCNPNGGGCGTAITPDGDFHTLSFNPGWVTVPLGQMYNPVWFDPAAGDAIHGDIPVPWYPASHGCVRIPMDIAAWFHNKVRVGGKHPTPVYIRGTAPYQPEMF
jgi:hypothetical protein